MLTSILLFFTLLSAGCPLGPTPAVQFSPQPLLTPSPSNPGFPLREGGVNQGTANPVVAPLLQGMAPGRSIECFPGGPAAGTMRSPATTFRRRGIVVHSSFPFDERDR